MKIPAKREKRKQAKPLPTLSELGFPTTPKISRPKATNKTALKRISKGEKFWDRKKVEKKLSQQNHVNKEYVKHANPKKHKLPDTAVYRVLKKAPNWVFENQTFKLKSGNNIATITETKEISLALQELKSSPAVYSIQNISEDDYNYLVRRQHKGSVITLI